MAAGRDYEVQTLGAFAPFPRDQPELGPGEVGFITAAIKDVADARVGDTITEAGRPADAPLPGFQPAKPMVFAGIFPTDSAHYEDLRDALDKLRLNDASFTREPETLGGAGLRVPLRLPGPAAHGDRPGAARARVQPGPHHHRADRALPPGARQRRRGSSWTTRPSSRPTASIDAVEEPMIAATIHTPARVRRARC